jgi:hypothetical protein
MRFIITLFFILLLACNTFAKKPGWYIYSDTVFAPDTALVTIKLKYLNDTTFYGELTVHFQTKAKTCDNQFPISGVDYVILDSTGVIRYYDFGICTLWVDIAKQRNAPIGLYYADMCGFEYTGRDGLHHCLCTIGEFSGQNKALVAFKHKEFISTNRQLRKSFKAFKKRG